MLKKDNLTNNKWLCGIFDLKEKWVMVYDRHMFTADMKNTQCSELMNNVLKKYLKSKYNILPFFGDITLESCLIVDVKNYKLCLK